MFVSAIVPAYNEGRTIAGVLKTLKDIEVINEIVVVSDGSKDNTADVAESFGVKVIRHAKNRGKGSAIKTGLENSSGDIILMLDADLIGLTSNHVNELLKPVIENEADMTVGIFSRGRFSTDLAQFIAPNLSGQRAVKKWVMNKINDLDTAGYGIEVALTRYAEKEGIRVVDVELRDITHVMKEEKFGFVRGFFERMKMYRDILRGMRLIKR
ncbi:MAG: glycosyltransferase family 2 protein [Clostridia bacterium]|nr:glycosyltransferase family 2 protein [Clostridia bacterium]